MDLYSNQGVFFEDIDPGDLARDVCKNCGVDITELDGIWYHDDVYLGPEHLARPGGER